MRQENSAAIAGDRLEAEMAGVIAFLLSDAAAYITGTMLWVDGGTDAAVRPDRF